MSNAVQQVNKMNTGLCPHGLPPSACPICSNMGGGGSLRVGERPQKAGEMSYHECAMIGAMMKARAQRLENQENALKARTEALLQFQHTLDKISQKLLQMAEKLPNIFILKPVVVTIRNVVVPIINFVKNIPTASNQIKQKFIDIQDKLNAIFGEAKAFVEKKISEIVSTVKSKLSSIFKIFGKDNAKDDDTKIDDDKKIFNLKTIIHKILKRKKKDDSESQSGS